MIRTGLSLAALAFCIAAPANSQDRNPNRADSPAPAASPATTPVTAAAADAFVARAQEEIYQFNLVANRVYWINANFITDDTDALVARYDADAKKMTVRLALEAARYARAEGLSADTKRKLDILRGGIVLPAPTRAGAADQLAELSTRMQSLYGRGRATRAGQPIGGSDVEAAMRTERDPERLREMWVSWHDNVGAPMRTDYARSIAIANEGARELGFNDVGAMWRSNYDMDPREFARLTDRLWDELKPLYQALHTYVRARLHARYGAAVQPASGPIRADLLGNMWAQEWGGIYDLVAPPGAGDIGFDTTQLLVSRNYDPLKMVRTGEAFFSSLGFAPLPETFYQRSLFVKPADREVQCHASAWDLDDKDDIRIKMCIKVNGDDFNVIHHELGHNYYQRAYQNQPLFYRDGANDGFHEAIGDMVALSITPEYLVQIGLLDAARVPSPDKDIGLLLRQAMDKVAFLPFGLLIDKWRWGVYSGSIPERGYQGAWDALRLQYQGIRPPVERDETRFDAGAKYHIPASVPYTRYFLARILQFQFFKAACDQAGWTGPLHRCSFYGNREVGRRLNAMLEMGRSRPWPDALEAFTGTREMSAKPLLDYFAPLMAWLEEQNRGQPSGW